jgi:hypothetical protein
MGDAAKSFDFDDENLSVGEYMDRWLSDAVRGTVRESTFSRDKGLAFNHIKPSIGRIKLKNLSATTSKAYTEIASTPGYRVHCTEDSPRRAQGTLSSRKVEPHAP